MTGVALHQLNIETVGYHPSVPSLTHIQIYVYLCNVSLHASLNSVFSCAKGRYYTQIVFV